MSANSIQYTPDFEILLKQEGEKAECLSILHSKSYIKFNWLSIYTNVPVIVLSALIGFLSPIQLFKDQNIFLGSLSVLCGIIKTFDSYFDFTKRSQTHYLTSLSYKKISKMIQIQLSLEKHMRISANDLLSVIMNDMENISSSEPYIPKDVIKDFNEQYHTYETNKPSIVNGLTNIKINIPEMKDIQIQTMETKQQEILEPKPKKTIK